MTKPAAWRRSCPEIVKNRISQALQATLYILHQTGPTAFLLKEDGTSKKLKVCLGDTHKCSCVTFSKEKELCVHILWVLLKKFHVPKDHEFVFQLGLVERDIDSVVRGHLVTHSSVPEGSSVETQLGVHQREVSEGDVCPICQEDLVGSQTSPLAFCKYGCGKSIHLKCIYVYANHLKCTGEADVPCPLCRNNFGSLKELCSQRHSAKKLGMETKTTKALHLGVVCSSCGMCPIAGRCYRCISCGGCYLCKACCEGVAQHHGHTMEFRQHPNQPWRTVRQAQSQIPTSFPPELVSGLQSRSITEEDYDLLLQLDRPSGDTYTVPERELCALPVKPLESDSTLILNGAQCALCNHTYARGEWIRSLPCNHEFHRDCVDTWIRSGHKVCPIDGKPVTKRKSKPQVKERTSSQDPTLTGCDGKDKLKFSVCGKGFEAAREQLFVSAVSGHCTEPAGSSLGSGAVTEGSRLSSTEISLDRYLPRLDLARGMVTSHLPLNTNHKRCVGKELMESRRRLLQYRQRWYHQPREGCTPNMFGTREQELPKCRGHSIHHKFLPPAGSIQSAACQNPVPLSACQKPILSATCQNPIPPVACQKPILSATCQNPIPPVAHQKPIPPATIRALQHTSRLRKLTNGRERHCTTEISHQNLGISLDVRQVPAFLTPTTS